MNYQFDKYELLKERKKNFKEFYSFQIIHQKTQIRIRDTHTQKKVNVGKCINL